MILNLDRVSRRYGQLPSDLLRRGDTFDFLVCDTAMAWEAEQQRRAQQQHDPQATPDIPLDSLVAMRAAWQQRENQRHGA